MKKNIKLLILGAFVIALTNVIISINTVNIRKKLEEYLHTNKNYHLAIKSEQALNEEDYKYLQNKYNINLYKNIENNLIKITNTKADYYYELQLIKYGIRLIIDNDLSKDEVVISNTLYDYIKKYNYISNGEKHKIIDNKLILGDKQYNIKIKQDGMSNKIKNQLLTEEVTYNKLENEFMIYSDWSTIYINNSDNQEYLSFIIKDKEDIIKLYDKFKENKYTITDLFDEEYLKGIKSYNIILFSVMLFIMILFLAELYNMIIRKNKININALFIFQIIISILVIILLNIKMNNILLQLSNVLEFNFIHILFNISIYILFIYINRFINNKSQKI